MILSAAATSAHSTLPASPASKNSDVRMIDAFMASSELEMVRYRLRLHEPITIKTIIVEASYTHAGQPKPLLVRRLLDSLPEDEKRRYNIRLVQVDATAEALLHARCRFASLSSSARSGDDELVAAGAEHAAYNKSECAHASRLARTATGGIVDARSLLEGQQRRAMNGAILEELELTNHTDAAAAAAATAAPPPLFVHVSDVDELLDPRHAVRLPALVPRCSAAHLYLYGFSEHCHYGSPRWMRSVIARASWLAPVLRERPDTELRMVHKEAIQHLISRGCADPRRHAPPHVGVHFSYFFSTASILSKLRSFLHAGDGGVRAVTQSANPEALVELKVRACTPMTSKLSNESAPRIRNWANVTRLVEEGRLPALLGWPKHPAWESSISRPES